MPNTRKRMGAHSKKCRIRKRKYAQLELASQALEQNRNTVRPDVHIPAAASATICPLKFGSNEITTPIFHKKHQGANDAGVQCALSSKVIADHYVQTDHPRTSHRAVSPMRSNYCSVATQVSFTQKLRIANVASNVLHIPQLFHDIIDTLQQHEDLAITIRSYVNSYATSLEITRAAWINTPEVGFSAATIVIQNNGQTHLVTMFGEKHVARITDDQLNLDNEKMQNIIKRISKAERVVWCEGIASKITVRDPSSNIKLNNFPCKDVRSNQCQGLFVAGRGVPVAAINDGKWVCGECSWAARYCQRKQCKSDLSPAKRRKIDASSNCAWQHLSPASQKRRRSALVKRHVLVCKDNQMLTKKLKVCVEKSFSKSMRGITQIIGDKYKDDLDNLMTSISSKSPNTAEILRCAWNNDVEKADFYRDQASNKTGRKQNRWSVATYRICLAIFSRSPSAYEALKNFGILELPGRSTLLRQSSSFSHNAGVDYKVMAEEMEKYKVHVACVEREGRPKPLGVGVLIFDEVKVINKVIWNSRSHEFMGIAMTNEEKETLCDLYSKDSNMDKLVGATYILQFLWRDLTSKYDVIGPYFTLPANATANIIASALHECLHAFSSFNFKVAAITCDGASTNLSTLKRSVNCKPSAFPTHLPYNELSVAIIDPHDSYNEVCGIPWIICPSHMLKNMISALHSSRCEGAKDFSIGGTLFGWKSIVDMKLREDRRVNQNQPQLVPRLLNSYVIRDPWTKLNVTPSRIMQQEHVLEELFIYANGSFNNGVRPPDSKHVLATRAYLYACSQIFEFGLLSKKPLRSMAGDAIIQIKAGMDFFQKWAIENESIEPKQKAVMSFLSWQTWDLLRIMVKGFLSLAETFFEKCPGYFIVPVKVNGSAVETLFSQFKAAAGNKLTSVNYKTSRKSILIRKNVAHEANKGYRDQELHLTM